MLSGCGGSSKQFLKNPDKRILPLRIPIYPFGCLGAPVVRNSHVVVCMGESSGSTFASKPICFRMETFQLPMWGRVPQMSYNLNSFKRRYIGDFLVEYYRIKGDTGSSDYSSNLDPISPQCWDLQKTTPNLWRLPCQGSFGHYSCCSQCGL